MKAHKGVSSFIGSYLDLNKAFCKQTKSAFITECCLYEILRGISKLIENAKYCETLRFFIWTCNVLLRAEVQQENTVAFQKRQS